MKIVLLPGMHGTGRLFTPFLRALPSGMEPIVIAYPLEMSAYRELLPLVRSALPRGERFLLLGESFSGPLAIEIAAERPPGLDGVVLCATFATSPLPRPMRGLARFVGTPFVSGVALRLAVRLLLGPHARGPMASVVREALSEIPAATLAARLREVLRCDVRPALAKVAVPILYLQPTEDRLLPPWCAATVRRARPDMTTVRVRSPHLVLQIAPEEAVRAISRVLIPD